MTDKHAQTTGATTASTEAGEQQTILSDCTALLWHHQRNVAQGRLQSEDVLLRAYVDGHCAVSEGLPPKRPETVAAAVVALFHGYLRQRRFLNATIAQLFGGDRWNVQARQRTLLGLLTHVLLFPRDMTLYDGQYKEDEEKRRDYVNAWTLATVRLLSKSKVSVRGAAAAAAENCIGGQAVAFLEQLFGGFIRTLPQPLPAKLEGRKGTSESIAGLMSAWIEVFEESFIAQRLVTPLTMIRGDLTRLVDALKVEVSGKLAEGSKAPTGMCRKVEFVLCTITRNRTYSHTGTSQCRSHSI